MQMGAAVIPDQLGWEGEGVSGPGSAPRGALGQAAQGFIVLTSEDGACTAALSSLFCGLAVLLEKRFSLMATYGLCTAL